METTLDAWEILRTVVQLGDLRLPPKNSIGLNRPSATPSDVFKSIWVCGCLRFTGGKRS
jgi:hypothetical protein